MHVVLLNHVRLYLLARRHVAPGLPVHVLGAVPTAVVPLVCHHDAFLVLDGPGYAGIA
jgi:hypothetical protein